MWYIHTYIHIYNVWKQPNFGRHVWTHSKFQLCGPGGAVRDNGIEPGCPSLCFFSPFFDVFPSGGLLGPFVSAVLHVTYGSAARRILSRASERASSSSSSSGRVSSGIVIDEGFPLTINNNVSFEKLVVYVLCALMKAFGLLSCFFLHHLAALKAK